MHKGEGNLSHIMLKTKLITNISDIPPEWIFEFYLNLHEKLIGQTVKIKSIFNPKDTEPSLTVYRGSKVGIYMFNDFSVGFSGTGFKLLEHMFPDKTRAEIFKKLVEDYTKYGKGYEKKETLVREFKLVDLVLRKWNVNDKAFWTKYNISSEILSKYKVIPIENFTTRSSLGNDYQEYTNSDKLCYGYFNKEGVVYKIYRPESELRFITFHTQIQGLDQLEGRDYLIISSSLKDIMSLMSFNITNIESIAPTGENASLPDQFISQWKRNYKKVITLFDNDQPGINAMERYEKLYNFPYAHIKLGKDLSDSVRDYGVEKTRTELILILKHIIHG